MYEVNIKAQPDQFLDWNSVSVNRVRLLRPDLFKP